MPSSASLECVKTLHPPPPTNTTNSSISALLPKTAISPAWSCTFSSNGNYLAICYGEPNTRIVIYCTSTWDVWHVLEGGHDRTIRSIDFSPFANSANNKNLLLASGSFDGTVCIWEYFPNDDGDDNNNSGGGGEWEITAQLEGHENEVKKVKWNKAGSLLASCGRDKSVWVWECLLPSSDGAGDVEFECVAVLQDHDGDVKDLCFTRSHGYWGAGDEILFSASYDNTIKLWAEDDDGEWFCATTLSPTTIHTSTIWSISTTPAGVRLISASADCTCAVWKFYTPMECSELNGDDDQDGGGGGKSSSNGLWKCIGKLPQVHKRVVYSVDCAPARAGHGRIASGGGDDSICIYKEVADDGGISGGDGDDDENMDVSTSLHSSSNQTKFVVDASKVNAHDGDVNCVKWSPLDGRILVSAGDDGLVKVWKYAA